MNGDPDMVLADDYRPVRQWNPAELSQVGQEPEDQSSNLAFLEIWFTSSTTTKLFVMLSSGQNTLSQSSCFAQNYFYFALGCTGFVLLAVMSFDRYVAICHPLLYVAIMKPQLCVHLGVAAWVS
ncbi:hypothetical protein DUI87_33684 [Hirundo rustica rustica]|uniref:G-protein coupled receptors family 1 profile domain-containing protein n=1 Tax=Hirundo rustica rustica TaxID=333673 RepID=A0A3M0IPR9_HIRRU|nr:hypothetical protein DUI87_33684 [Hirundo rustica rustica]